MAALYQLEGTDVVRVYKLPAGWTTLGRDLSNQVVLADPSVSRFHCRIRLERAAAWIEDLQTRNGTFVCGRQINNPRNLASGDRLQLGRQSFVYWNHDGDESLQETTIPGSRRHHDNSIAAKVLPLTPAPLESCRIRAWWWFGWNGFCVGWRIQRR